MKIGYGKNHYCKHQPIKNFSAFCVEIFDNTLSKYRFKLADKHIGRFLCWHGYRNADSYIKSSANSYDKDMPNYCRLLVVTGCHENSERIRKSPAL